MKCMMIAPVRSADAEGGAAASEVSATIAGQGQDGGAPSPSDAATAEQEQNPDDDADGDDEDEGDDKPRRKRPGKYQRTVSRLEAQVQTLTTMLAAQMAGGAKPETAKSPTVVPGAAPKQEDFPTYDAFLIAQAKHELRQEMTQEERSRAERATQNEIASNWQRQVDAGRKEFGDFEEVAFSAPISESVARIVAESEMGAKLAYYLGTNPAEARRISALPATSAARELGKLEVKLSAPPPPKKTTAAPPPPPTVNGGSSAAPAVPDPNDTAAWIKHRNQQLAAKRGKR